MTTKIEIRMKKKMGVQWKTLEGAGTDGTEGVHAARLLRPLSSAPKLTLAPPRILFYMVF